MRVKIQWLRRNSTEGHDHADNLSKYNYSGVYPISMHCPSMDGVDEEVVREFETNQKAQSAAPSSRKRKRTGVDDHDGTYWEF